MSDLVRTVASVFRRKGAPEITASEFKHALSLDLRWFAPADARKLLAHAVNTGLVEENGERIAARFDVARVDVPVAFRPSLGVLDESPPAPPPRAPPALSASASVADEALDAAARASGLDRAAMDKEAADERDRRGGLFTLEVAALVIARRRGVDVRPLAARLR